MSGSRIENKNIILTLYESKRTVFRLTDISLMEKESNFTSLNSRLNYAVRTGKLLNPRKGIYAKPGYNREELACSVFMPSYISLDYVLQKEGIIFQYDPSITVVSYLRRDIEVDSQWYRFRRINPITLTNLAGINRLDNHVNIATPERAFLDFLYLEKEAYFDYTESLNKKEIKRLLPLYNSKKLQERVQNQLF